MSETDPLKAFFDADDTPVIDVEFRTGVMEAVSRRRLRIELGLCFLAGLLLVVALWAVSPALDVLASAIQTGLTQVYLALAVTAVIAATGHYLTRNRLPSIRIPQIRIF